VAWRCGLLWKADFKKRTMTDKEKANPQSNLGRWIAKTLREATEPVYVLDSQGRLAFGNDALATWLGVELDQIVGLDCSQSVAADNQPLRQIASFLAAPRHVGREAFFEKPIQISEGSEPALCMGVALGSTPTDWFCRIVIQPDELAKSAMPEVSEDHVQQVLTSLRANYSRLDGLHSLVGASSESKRALAQCQLAIESNQPLLIVGPVGSGKSETARAIFTMRLRRLGITDLEGRLHPIDCRLMDASLLRNMMEMVQESHRQAKQNTVLLERIDSLPEEAHDLLQAAIRQWTKMVWIATSRHPAPQELFPSSRTWRNIVTSMSTTRVDICSLVERPGDIPILIESLMPRVLQESKRLTSVRFSQDAMEMLQSYTWPNNARELRQAMLYAINQSDGSVLEPKHLPLAIRTFASKELQADRLERPVDLDAMLTDFEREMIEQAIQKFPRNRAAAAQWLGISRSRLLRRLEQLGLADKFAVTEKPDRASDDTPVEFIPEPDVDTEIDFQPAPDEE
jgi:DNA-binding NtrC family response regulator